MLEFFQSRQRGKSTREGRRESVFTRDVVSGENKQAH